MEQINWQIATRMTTFIDFKPQLSSEEHGGEPSIRELIRYYYMDCGCNDWPELTDQYIKALAEQFFGLKQK